MLIFTPKKACSSIEITIAAIKYTNSNLKMNFIIELKFSLYAAKQVKIVISNPYSPLQYTLYKVIKPIVINSIKLLTEYLFLIIAKKKTREPIIVNILSII